MYGRGFLPKQWHKRSPKMVNCSTMSGRSCRVSGIQFQKGFQNFSQQKRKEKKPTSTAEITKFHFVFESNPSNMHFWSESKVLMGLMALSMYSSVHSINVFFLLNCISYFFKYINQASVGKTDPLDNAINMNYHLSNMHNGLKIHNSRCSLND